MAKKLFTPVVLIFAILPAIKAQTLKGINNKLTFIYSQVFKNIDTTHINYRKETADLINSGDSLMRLNGHITLGLLEFYRNKYDNAIVEFKKAIQLDPLCYICYNQLHWSYWYGKNDYDDAFNLWKTGVIEFDQAYMGDSLNLNKLKKLYEVYSLREGKLPVKIYERKKYLAHLIVQSDSMNAYNWWEYSFYQENDAVGREYSLKKAYTLEGSNTIYWNALAGFYADKKNIPALKEVLEQSRPAENSDMSYWYQQKANYLYTLKLKTEAAAVYQEAKSKGYHIVYKY